MSSEIATEHRSHIFSGNMEYMTTTKTKIHNFEYKCGKID